MSAGREAGEGAPGRTRRTADTKRDPSMEQYLISTFNRVKLPYLVDIENLL